ncbi:Crp/Fnr family transcriptional regulator [Dyadobacter pollutisoli]|uniref:Crp/Fnr family transcriptional regulator n=1 Tax=Dyadobacter pollutisoli TaxID=2910158 RepID=A0A9E8NGQ0_9BACT|nr:Crp/Fnr family transcriptional regulator [Dyadobacter pollutisoli]WAC14692.1 Crp/Fnr family transcriptional regulator [Dyadobacter pollutisoli]
MKKSRPSFDFNTQSPLFDAFERKAVSLDLREGAPVFYPDQMQDSLYFVKKGVMRSYIRHNDIEVTRWFYSAGDLAYSALSVFHGLPSDICLVAACPSIVMQIYKEDYCKLCDGFPEFRQTINDLQGSFLYRYAHYNDSARTLLRIERYRKFLDEFPLVGGQVQIRHQASFLGMTPDTLSKIRKQFQNKASQRMTLT